MGQLYITKSCIFLLQRLLQQKHLEVIFEGLSVKVRWFNHDDYVQHKLDKLKIARQESATTEEFVEYLLSECRSCNYVIFNGENENKFIQFWLGDGKLMADYPILKKNGLKRYRYQMLGVLNELDIHAVKDGMKNQNEFPIISSSNLQILKDMKYTFKIIRVKL